MNFIYWDYKYKLTCIYIYLNTNTINLSWVLFLMSFSKLHGQSISLLFCMHSQISRPLLLCSILRAKLQLWWNVILSSFYLSSCGWRGWKSTQNHAHWSSSRFLTTNFNMAHGSCSAVLSHFLNPFTVSHPHGWYFVHIFYYYYYF